MEAYQGRGAWRGRAEGRLHWVVPFTEWDRRPTADRVAEIARLKHGLQAAQFDIDRWMEKQPTLEGRILLQGYREALQDPSFTHRATLLIDLHGLPAPAALVEAASLVAGVMGRSEELVGRARALPVAARWLAGRLQGIRYPAGAILVAQELSPLELLDRSQPAIVGSGDPAVIGEAPLVWGLAELSPEWDGRQGRIDDEHVFVAAREEASLPYQAERLAVLETARQMKRDGLVRLTSGNVSCRIPGTTLFAITPSGMEYEQLEPADICILDLDGNLVDGHRRPSSEMAMHRLTYLRRPEVGGVVHTHSIYASAFACTGQELPVISTELAGLVGGTIQCAPYAPAGTLQFAETALAILGDEAVAVLFQNHGVMAVGKELKRAYDVAVGLEEAAMIYFIARQVGQPIILPAEERQRIFRAMQTAYGQPKE